MRFLKMFIPFFTAFLLLATSSTFSLCVGEELIKGKPALPGKTCQTKPLFNWTPQEKWVWNQICNGEIADFNERDKEYDKVFDPKNHKRKPKGRLLTSEFLETILLHEPFCGSLTHHGVRIVGAWFKDPIDLTNATLNHQLWLDKSCFDSDIDLSFLKTDYGISLDGSYFNGKLNLNSAKIGGQLNMNGSKFTDKLIMDSLYVGGYLKMCDPAEFNYVSLLNSKIDSALEMDGSRFKGELLMQRLEVENNLFMRKAEFVKVILDSAKIRGNLELSGSECNFIHLSNTNIGREFILSSKNTDEMQDVGAVEWHGDSKLTLHNTKVGVLQDSQNSWPKNLELNGFIYERLGKFIKNDGSDIKPERDITWLKKWMWKQEKYSPQPYEHLAKILRPCIQL